jgi:hypothetical protein
MKSDLIVGTGIFEALMPGSARKHPQCMGSQSQIIEDQGLAGVVVSLVWLVIQNHMQVWPQPQIGIFKQGIVLDRDADLHPITRYHLIRLGTSDLY